MRFIFNIPICHWFFCRQACGINLMLAHAYCCWFGQRDQVGWWNQIVAGICCSKGGRSECFGQGIGWSKGWGTTLINLYLASVRALLWTVLSWKMFYWSMWALWLHLPIFHHLSSTCRLPSQQMLLLRLQESHHLGLPTRTSRKLQVFQISSVLF